MRIFQPLSIRNLDVCAGDLDVGKDNTEIIELANLRQMANKKGRFRLAAQRALTKAEALNAQRRLGVIRLNKDEKCLQVYEIDGSLNYSHPLAS